MNVTVYAILVIQYTASARAREYRYFCLLKMNDCSDPSSIANLTTRENVLKSRFAKIRLAKYMAYTVITLAY